MYITVGVPNSKIPSPNEPLLDQPDSVGVQHGGGGCGEIHFGVHPSLTGGHGEDVHGDDDLSGHQRKIHFSACLGPPPRELCLYWRTEVQEFSGWPFQIYVFGPNNGIFLRRMLMMLLLLILMIMIKDTSRCPPDFHCTYPLQSSASPYWSMSAGKCNWCADCWLWTFCADCAHVMLVLHTMCWQSKYHIYFCFLSAIDVLIADCEFDVLIVHMIC